MANAGRGELLWEPSAESVERSTMTRYMRWLATERGRAFDDYQALWEWSVRELEEFWASIWDFFEVRASAPYSRVLADRAMPGASWFEGARLNFAEHVFRDKPADRVAVLPRLRAPRARRAPLGRASGRRSRARRPGCAPSASSRATVSSPTCPTSRRR